MDKPKSITLHPIRTTEEITDLLKNFGASGREATAIAKWVYKEYDSIADFGDQYGDGTLNPIFNGQLWCWNEERLVHVGQSLDSMIEDLEDIITDLDGDLSREDAEVITLLFFCE